MASQIEKKAYTLNDVKINIKTEDGDAETIGLVQAVKVDVTVTQNIIHEAGNQGLPVSRVFTKKEISGSFDRTLVDVAVLKKLWDNTSDNPIVFDLQGIGVNANSDEKNFIVESCAINGFPLEMDLDTETTQSIEYQALNFRWE